MAAASRRDPADLSRRLFEEASEFEFAQAVRLLRKLWPERAAVGHDHDPAREVVRFRSSTSFAFPASGVCDLSPVPDTPAAGADASAAQQPADMQVSFMGVAAPASFGSLPSAYTQEILEQLRARNPALRDFLDLFNHRAVSLYYRALEKSHLALAHDVAEHSAFETVLCAVAGMGTGGLGGRLPFNDRSLLARAGLLALAPVPACVLESLIDSLFGLRAEVVQFAPAWYELEPEDCTKLGQSGSRLGEDLHVGSRICLAQARFRIRLGPLDRARYERLLPGGSELELLASLVRLASGPDLDFELQYVLAAAEVPPLRLASASEQPCRLGWSTWLGGEPHVRDADQATFLFDGSRGFTGRAEVRA